MRCDCIQSWSRTLPRSQMADFIWCCEMVAVSLWCIAFCRGRALLARIHWFLTSLSPVLRIRANLKRSAFEIIFLIQRSLALSLGLLSRMCSQNWRVLCWNYAALICIVLVVVSLFLEYSRSLSFFCWSEYSYNGGRMQRLRHFLAKPQFLKAVVLRRKRISIINFPFVWWAASLHLTWSRKLLFF